MYPSSAREVAGQHASSSGEEQLPYHNLDEKEDNLFSTRCVAAFSGEAFWVVSIITAQSPSSKGRCQCWLNSVFSESRLEVLTFIGFQMSNWQSNSQSRIGRRPQAAQNRFWCQFPSADKYWPTKSNINLPSRLSINKQSCWYTNTRYQRAPDTFMLFFEFITLQHFLLKSFTKALNF